MDEFKSEQKSRNDAKKADDINLLSMIESRMMEIVSIEDACKRKMPKLFQQRLPRYMRRRAASHNVKRLPRRFWPKTSTGELQTSKSRKGLMKYRRRLQFRKHKRVLKRHQGHKFKDPDKTVLHKWFAKRFKMSKQEPSAHVPLYNNTKNQRNLYRQTRYGCAYLSLANLDAIMLLLARAEEQDGKVLSRQLKELNRLTCSISGFTFEACSIQGGNYEAAVHLYELDEAPKGYLCPALLSALRPNDQHPRNTRLILWIPREFRKAIMAYLKTISVDCRESFETLHIEPNKWTRIRLVGPAAREESFKICDDKDASKIVADQADQRIHSSLGVSLGKCIEEKKANFVYYSTSPNIVDIVFKEKEGRMLWHQLVKNKAHLVGGYRDVNRLLEVFKLSPDNEKYDTKHQEMQEDMQRAKLR